MNKTFKQRRYRDREKLFTDTISFEMFVEVIVKECHLVNHTTVSFRKPIDFLAN